jgi:signal recognition particle GTPase
MPPHLPSHYHLKQSQQVEQIRREASDQIQSFQQTVLEEIRKNRKQNYEMHMEVRQLKEEMRQMQKQIEALVLHLLLPDLSLKKIQEAISDITEYHGGLQKRQDAFDTMRFGLTSEITKLSSALTLLISPETITEGPITDKRQSLKIDKEFELDGAL